MPPRARVLLQVFSIFKAVGNYAKADKMLEQFMQNQPQTSVETFASQRDYLNEIKENSGKYEILMRDQLPYSDYGSAYYITPYFCLGTRYRW
jgi:hypothetical protein